MVVAAFDRFSGATTRTLCMRGGGGCVNWHHGDVGAGKGGGGGTLSPPVVRGADWAAAAATATASSSSLHGVVLAPFISGRRRLQLLNA